MGACFSRLKAARGDFSRGYRKVGPGAITVPSSVQQPSKPEEYRLQDIERTGVDPGPAPPLRVLLDGQLPVRAYCQAAEHLTTLAQKVTTKAVQPVQAGVKSAFNRTA
jgi:hypothetical protein